MLANDPQPLTISVAIPVFNGELELPEALEALNAQECLPDEVIIADDASQDGTANVVERYSAKVSYPIRCYRLQINSGIGAARYIAASHATGDIVAQIDADSIPPPQWLREIKQIFISNPNVIAVSGPVREISQSVFRKVGTAAVNLFVSGLGGNTSFRRSVFPLTPRGRGESLPPRQEDVVFWRELGSVGKCVYDPRIWVWHRGDKKWLWLGMGVTAGLAGLGLKHRTLAAFGAGVTLVSVTTWNAAPGGTKSLSGGLLPHIHHDLTGLLGLLASNTLPTKMFYSGIISHHVGTEGIKLITEK